MKTLDEVIEALNNCADVNANFEACECCEYRDIRDDGYDCGRLQMMEDALHYLYEYKLLRQTPIMQGIHKMQKDFALYPVGDWGEDEPDFNPPLSWDELKSMTGKPVWVEALLYKQWAVIAYIGEEYIRFEGANLYAPECRIYMGEDNGWQAYRKERS